MTNTLQDLAQIERTEIMGYLPYFSDIRLSLVLIIAKQFGWEKIRIFGSRKKSFFFTQNQSHFIIDASICYQTLEKDCRKDGNN